MKATADLLADPEDDFEPDATDLYEHEADDLDPEPEPAAIRHVMGGPCARCSLPFAEPLRLLCPACSAAVREESRARVRAHT
ncbi:MAG: hypothetical protein AB7Q42_20885 [Acidimicrobiia bacterium]